MKRNHIYYRRPLFSVGVICTSDEKPEPREREREGGRVSQTQGTRHGVEVSGTERETGLGMKARGRNRERVRERVHYFTLLLLALLPFMC